MSSAVENRPNLSLNEVPHAKPEIATQVKELVKKISWVVWAMIAAAAVILSFVVSVWVGAAVGVLSALSALAIANCKMQPTPVPRELVTSERPPIRTEALDPLAIRHDAADWKRKYEAADVEGKRRMNAALGQQTLDAIDHGFVFNDRVIRLDHDLRARVIHHTEEMEQGPGNAPQEILVENLTTLQMTERLLQRGLNPLMADFANKKDVAGDFLGGARAQEETLCRESDLYRRLDAVRDQYPIPERGGILVPQVQYFRKDPADGYAFMEPIKADTYAMAFYNCNRAHGDGYDKPESNEEYLEGTREKIRPYFRTAMANGNDALVFGAGGCGAFRNDPRVIADICRTELNRPEFRNRFQVVAFAVIDDHNVRPGHLSNYQTFRQIILEIL